MQGNLLTAREISRQWRTATREQRPLPMTLLGDFLDDFRLRARTSEEKAELVDEEPIWTRDGQCADSNAYLAAVVESLCREVGMRPPAWTEKRRYFLRRPWFAGGLENLKAVLLVESPVPFRRRNLFVSANAMVRV